MIENVMTYLWIVVFTFAVLLTIGGILRWLANTNENIRKNRLKIISICAFIVLVVMLLYSNWNGICNVLASDSDASNLATALLINISKITIKVLLIVLIVAFALIIAFIAVLLVVYSVKAIKRTILGLNKDNNEDKIAELKQELKKETEKITVLLKTPVFIVTIVGGVLALYLVFPLIMGEDSQSLAKCWIDGVARIVACCTNNVHNSFSENLSLYTLIFIMIIGIGYGAVNILFEIIKERFEKKTVFLREYSNSIGLLAVGISVLLLISSMPDILKDGSWEQKLIDYLEPFVLVIFVIAMGILILEIVRLLIDMREKIIRHEARYLFVLLTGLCTVIIMKAVLIFYNTISGIFSRNNIQADITEERIQGICDRILEKVAEDMEEEVEKDDLQIESKVPYNTFKGKITKK